MRVGLLLWDDAVEEGRSGGRQTPDRGSRLVLLHFGVLQALLPHHVQARLELLSLLVVRIRLGQTLWVRLL